MKKILLTQGQIALVDDEDFDFINQWKWYYEKKNRNNTGYAIRTVKINGKRKRLYMHRVLLKAPDGMEVDHKNMNGIDNRKENIRVCTCLENKRHYSVRRDNRTGIKGVSWDKRRQKYRVQISIKGKRLWLGTYNSLSDATTIYNEAARQYYKEFAYLNKI